MSGVLGTRCFAGAEAFVQVAPGSVNVHCEWVFAAKDAPGGPYRFLERRNGLATIVERGTSDIAERRRVNPPRPDCDFITIYDGRRQPALRLERGLSST